MLGEPHTQPLDLGVCLFDRLRWRRDPAQITAGYDQFARCPRQRRAPPWKRLEALRSLVQPPPQLGYRERHPFFLVSCDDSLVTECLRQRLSSSLVCAFGHAAFDVERASQNARKHVGVVEKLVVPNDLYRALGESGTDRDVVQLPERETDLDRNGVAFEQRSGHLDWMPHADESPSRSLRETWRVAMQRGRDVDP